LTADYTATEINADAATKLVEQAEKYLHAVKRAFDLQQSAKLEAVPPEEIEDNQSHNEQSSATGGVEDEMEEARRRGREEWLKLHKQKLESGAPTLEQRRKKGVEDWINLRRQQNRPVKDKDLQRRGEGADLEPGEQANDSAKGGDDDHLEP
jgi:hypothetical protein